MARYNISKAVIGFKPGNLMDRFAYLPRFPDQDCGTQNPVVEFIRKNINHAINSVLSGLDGAVRIVQMLLAAKNRFLDLPGIQHFPHVQPIYFIRIQSEY
ncbi:hypothetical protein D3C80_1241380 [compost metagenome]